jgi:hypothetical protein
MLGKLMKYEFKATARYFVPAYIVILILTILNRVFFSLADNQFQTPLFMRNDLFREIITLISGMTMFLYVIAICALFIFTFIIFIYRFYKNLLSLEGYLMMTLPVRPSQHIWAKLHTSFVWSIASTVVCFLSIVILVFTPQTIPAIIQFMPDALKEIMTLGTVYKIHFIFYFIEFLILFIISIYASNMFYYACLALGHRFSKTHRILYSIGAYLVISFIMQIISVIAIVLTGFIFNNSVWEPLDPFIAVHFMLIGMIICSIIEFILFYFITENTLSKKLNLE